MTHAVPGGASETLKLRLSMTTTESNEKSRYLKVNLICQIAFGNGAAVAAALTAAVATESPTTIRGACYFSSAVRSAGGRLVRRKHLQRLLDAEAHSEHVRQANLSNNYL